MPKTLEERVSELEKIIYGEQEVVVPYINFGNDVDDISLPKRNKVGDIGYDAFARETVIVPAHSSAKVPLGIGAIIPDGFSIAARTRGGRWLNGLLVGDAHVDWNYRGEINALLYNVTDKDIVIEKGERPCSIDLFKTYKIKWQSLEDYMEETGLTKDEIMNTNRGDTGFGNSGK